MKMLIFPRWFKDLVKRSNTLMKLRVSLHWKFHLFKDWWGTKIWTITREVVTPLGFKLNSGFHPAYKMMRNGTFEVNETAIISKLLPSIDLFVDVGANLGYYTCLALQSGKPVIAFEPQQQNLKCLFQNLKTNEWEKNVEIFPLALSDHPGLLNLYGASGPSASLIKNWASYSSHFKKIVPVSTLDNILAGRFPDQHLLIKIDVEGAELNVLKGSLATLGRKPKPTWLIEICLEEFHPDGKNPDYEEIFKLFWGYGYNAFIVTENLKLVSPDDLSHWAAKGTNDSGAFNYVFAESKFSLQ